MTSLVIFTIVALAGCAFLIYFMFALWRDSRDSRKGPRVEIRSREFPMSSHSYIHKEAMAIKELESLPKKKAIEKSGPTSNRPRIR